MKFHAATKEVMMFECPGCETLHSISVAVEGWKFNGDMEKPTVTPSILVNKHLTKCEEASDTTFKRHRCHSFITDGKIKFLDDCTHSLAGKEVELPDMGWDKYAQ